MPRASSRFALVLTGVCCVALALVGGVAAQESAGFFERVDGSLGIGVDTAVGAAWGDADADGDPDLVVVDADGALTLWRNGGGSGFGAQVLEGLTGSATAVRWFDADGDGDLDLLTSGAPDGFERVWENGPDGFGESVQYSAVNALTQQVLDVDGDGRLDVYVGAAEGDETPRSGIVVRRGAGYARATIEEFAPGESQRLSTLYRATVEDPLELYSGGAIFPDHRFVFDSVGPRYLGEMPDGSQDVLDVVSGDFDGDLVSELFLLRSNPDAAIATSEDGTEITFVVSALDSVASVTIGGAPELDVEVLDQRGLETFEIQFGRDREQGDSYSFSIDASLGSGSNVQRGVDVGLFVSAPDPDRFRFVLSGIDAVTAEIRVRAAVPIEVVQSVGLPTDGGALSDQFYERSDERWIRSQLLGTSTECNVAAAGDFDNDMDLDLYLGCGNAIEKTPNRLFLNVGGGRFREPELVDGALVSMSAVTGVSVADVDSDGWLELFVQSAGGGPSGGSALLSPVGGENHWLGLDLVGGSGSPGGVGAAVVLETDEVVQRRDQVGGAHGRAQDDTRVHFGLGRNEVAERVTVYWPSGRVQVIDEVPADQYLTLDEPAADTPFADVRLLDLRTEPVVQVGDRLEVRASARNEGTAPAQGAVLTFALPEGWDAVRLPAEVSVEGSVVRWPLPSVAPGQSLEVTLAIEVVSPSGPGEVQVSAEGAFPRNTLTADVVTGDNPSRPFGALWLFVAIVAGVAVLGTAGWLAARRRR